MAQMARMSQFDELLDVFVDILQKNWENAKIANFLTENVQIW